jgi:hypothetical protein
MTNGELVKRFAEIGIAQDDALFHDQYVKFNRLYEQMDQTERELRARGTDARRALMRLYRHSNYQVRLNAAKRTLAIAPTEARQVLQNMYDSKLYPQAGDAGMCLSNLDDGTFKPE